MEEPIISVSGLRGVIGRSLTPLVAARYAAAFAAELPEGPVLITRDSRTSGPLLAAVLEATLAACGHHVFNAGIAATPTTGILLRELGCVGGIQISASHNPIEYNGLKLFSSEGRVIPAAPGAKVLAAYRAGEFGWSEVSGLGRADPCQSGVEEHLAKVLGQVDAGAIARRRFKVLLDANRGAGSLLGRRLLTELGCQLTVLGENPDGRFEHPPEPTAENLRGVSRQVADGEFDIAFCQDPDADRLAIIDGAGRYIGEEYTLALCVERVLPQRKGPVVTNCATSRMTFDLAERHGGPAIRTAVGEANVVDAMLSHNAAFGGEGNGGPIDPQVGLVRDSFVGMALVLDTMAATGLPIARLADRLPHYEIVKSKMPLARAQMEAALERLETHFSDARSDRQDGLRLDFPDSWVLVRGSNTEPIVRVIAEAPRRQEAQQLVEEASAILEML